MSLSGIPVPLPVTDVSAESSLSTIATNTTGAATAANQTGGGQKTQVVDASGNVASIFKGLGNGQVVSQNSCAIQVSLSGAQSANAPLPITVTQDSTNNPTTTTYINALNYGAVFIQVPTGGVGTGFTNFNLFVSLDHSTWLAYTAIAYPVNAGAISATMGATGFYQLPGGCYYQIQTNGTQSGGTSTVNVLLAPSSYASSVALNATQANFIGNVKVAAGTGIGMSSYAPIAGLASSPTQIGSTGARSVYAVDLYNPNGVTEYVAFYNTASITYSTSVPIYWFAIPANSPKQAIFTVPWAFSTTLYYVTSSTAPGGTLTAPSSAILGSIGFN